MPQAMSSHRFENTSAPQKLREYGSLHVTT